jgi:hypothetical protein
MACTVQALPNSRHYNAELGTKLERGQYAWHRICYLILASLPAYGHTTQGMHSDASPEGRTRAWQHGHWLTQLRERLTYGLWWHRCSRPLGVTAHRDS